MPEFLAQWSDRGPPSHSPQLDQEPLWRRANGSPRRAWKLRSVGHRLPFRGGFACLQERGALRGSSLPRSSGIFSKFFLDFPLPGLFRSSALRRVVLVCRVGPSPQIASLSHSHRPSHVIYRQRALPSLLPPPPPPRLPSICTIVSQILRPPPSPDCTAWLRFSRILFCQPDTVTTKTTSLVGIWHRGLWLSFLLFTTCFHLPPHPRPSLSTSTLATPVQLLLCQPAVVNCCDPTVLQASWGNRAPSSRAGATW